MKKEVVHRKDTMRKLTRHPWTSETDAGRFVECHVNENVLDSLTYYPLIMFALEHCCVSSCALGRHWTDGPPSLRLICVTAATESFMIWRGVWAGLAEFELLFEKLKVSVLRPSTLSLLRLKILKITELYYIELRNYTPQNASLVSCCNHIKVKYCHEVRTPSPSPLKSNLFKNGSPSSACKRGNCTVPLKTENYFEKTQCMWRV